MKKKLLLAGVVALMTAAAVTGYKAYSKTGMVDLLSANVEALAQDEGTKVGQCFFTGWGGATTHAVFCSRRTSTEMIYPCEEESWDVKGGTSLCTKRD